MDPDYLTQKISDEVKKYNKSSLGTSISLASSATVIIELMNNQITGVNILKCINRGLLEEITQQDCYTKNNGSAINLTQSKFIIPSRYVISFKAREKASKSFLEECAMFFTRGRVPMVTTFTLISDNRIYEIRLYDDEPGELLVHKVLKNIKRILVVEIRTENGRVKEISNEYLQVGEFDIENRVELDANSSVRINHENAERCIKFLDIDDSDERIVKKHYEIRKELASIRNELKGNKDLLELIVLNFIGNKLQGISLNAFQQQLSEGSGKIYQRLEKLVEEYRDELERNTSLEELLCKITLEAQYELITCKEKSINVDHIMSILCKAEIQLDKMKNKELVMFIGSTGAGKSTIVSYLLGATLESSQNRMGECVVKISGVSDSFPIIGQSVGTSETTYAQGFEFDTTTQAKEGFNNCLLCDCPGFHDTRGTEYELCTNLSIDKTIKQSENIKAIVLVIPYASFLVERGQIILKTFETLTDMVPSFLEENEIWKSVFILITKTAGFENILKSLKNRIIEHIIECQTLISHAASAGIEGCGSYDTIAYVQRKLAIWQKILKILEADQLKIIFLTNKAEKPRLLRKFTQSPSIPRAAFNSTMLTEEMIKKFGDLIEISAHTWTANLIPRYLYEIPETLQKSINSIDIHNYQIEDLGNLCKEYENYIEIIQNDLKTLKKDLIELDKMKSMYDTHQITTEEFQKFLETKKYDSNNSNQMRIDSQKKYCEDLLKHLKEAENNKNEAISLLKLKTEKLNSSVENLLSFQKSVSEMSEGSQKKILYEYKPNPYEKDSYYILKPGARERSIAEVRPLNDSDYLNENVESGKTNGEVVGKYTHTVFLERRFRVVPKENKKDFYNFKETRSENDSYLAIFENYNCRIDCDPKNSPDGKKVIYPVESTWIGDPLRMPWFTISHVIPNFDVNLATIINSISQITITNQNISVLRAEISELNRNSKGLDQEVSRNRAKYNEESKSLEFIENDIVIGDFANILSNMKNLETINEGKLKSYREIISTNKGIIKKSLETIHSLELVVNSKNKEKLFLALVIYNHLESGRQLLKFCDMVRCNDMKSPGTHREKVNEECKKFCELFNSTESTLREQTANELGIN